MSEITSLSKEEVTLCEVSKTREDEFSDNEHVLDVCRKRKRSDEEEREDVAAEEDNDGFKTPTRPENRIPQLRECPAPKRGESTYAMILRGLKMSSRRRLDFSPEPTVSSFITDIQWRTTMTIEK